MVKASFTDKGGSAEGALAQYFRAAGFIAIRGLPFRHDGDDITDVDVWLYERGSGLERRRFIVDAKYKARPKIAERLLWTAGLRDALEVDGGFVAATGVRDTTRRLARRIDITIIDFQALGGGSIEKLKSKDRRSKEEISKLLGDIDKQRESKLWRSQVSDALAALLISFGGGSANVALREAHFYADQATLAAPGSIAAGMAVRLFYLCAAVAGISLDYVAAQGAFQPPDKRRAYIEEIIRFGADHQEKKARIDLALELTRQYLPNGSTLANQLRDRLLASAAEIPAAVIEEVVSKMVGKGILFEAAKSLENAAHMINLPGFMDLQVEAKTLVGAVLDFVGVDRERLADAWSPAVDDERAQPEGSQTASLSIKKSRISRTELELT